MQMVINTPARIDANTAAGFDAAVKQILANGALDLLFEMRDTIYVSSAGLRVFLAAQKKISAAGGRMALQHVGPQAMEVFEVTGFSGILSIFSGLAAES